MPLMQGNSKKKMGAMPFLSVSHEMARFSMHSTKKNTHSLHPCSLLPTNMLISRLALLVSKEVCQRGLRRKQRISLLSRQISMAFLYEKQHRHFSCAPMPRYVLNKPFLPRLPPTACVLHWSS